MKSYYQYIDGVRYDRGLIEAAKEATKGQGEYQISFDEIRELYRLAEDGPRITDTERRTLHYISKNFQLTNKAEEWLNATMEEPTPGNDLEQIITRVIQEEFRLKKLSWQINPAEVRLQEEIDPTRMFEEALRGALNAFLSSGINQLSLEAFVRRQGAMDGEVIPQEKLLRSYLDQGTLFLVPKETTGQNGLGYDLPDELDLDRSWTFVLRIPVFYPCLFVAYVRRSRMSQYSTGYFARSEHLDDLVSSIVRQFLGFDGLDWVFDEGEIQEQLSLKSGQNFGNALFAALNGAIFNGESSLSLRDFISMEIWQDPDRTRNEYMIDYINTGKLHLLPLEYREQTEAGTAAFPVPANFSLWQDTNWYFGLEMPERTEVRFLMNVPRDADDGQTGWNDGFILPSELEFVEELRQVAANEFELSNLQLDFSEDRFKAQQSQFGPSWRNAPGLLRQAINTILNDYLTASSVFYVVSQVHAVDVDPEKYEDPLEYRAAIRELIRGYLDAGSMEFLPIELPDNNPVDGEEIEDYWQFFVMLPTLSDHGFWVIIPRWPEDEELPYVYGAN